MLLKKAIPDPTALILTAFSALPCSEAFVYCQFHMEKLLSGSLPPRHQSPYVSLFPFCSMRHYPRDHTRHNLPQL